MKFKIAYFGSPDFSARLLEKITQDENLPVAVTLVVTQPDQPVGRKQILTASPVKEIAKKYDLPIVSNLKEAKKTLTKYDFALVYAYGQIIPAECLHLPRLGFINVHPSLLPLYRGPSPIAYPLFLGEEKTGVTLIQMDEQIDHGPMIYQQEMKISPDDKRTDLETKLTDLSFTMIQNRLIPLIDNQLKLTQQKHGKATYTRLLTKNDGFIDLTTLKRALSRSQIITNELPTVIKDYFNQYPDEIGLLTQRTADHSLLIFNLFRGLSPWPGLWTKVLINGRGKRLKITDMTLRNSRLMVKEVQLEGKKEVDFEQFNRTYQIFNQT